MRLVGEVFRGDYRNLKDYKNQDYYHHNYGGVGMQRMVGRQVTVIPKEAS